MTKSLTDCAELMDDASEADEATGRTWFRPFEEVRGGIYGNGEAIGSVLVKMGATMGTHSLANGLSSTLRVSSCSS